MKTPLWKLSLLGRFELEHEGSVVGRFGGRLDEQLLAYLALHAPSVVSRSTLAKQIWPQMAEAHARKQVSFNLFQAKKRLSDAGLPDGIEKVRVSLRLRGEVVVDVAVFVELLAQAARTPDVAQQTRLLETAAAMYGSGLLPQMSAPWVTPHRERFEQLYAVATRALGDPEARAGLLASLAPLLPSSAWASAERSIAEFRDEQAYTLDLGKDVEEYVQEAGRGLRAKDRAEWLEGLRSSLPQIQDAVTSATSEGRLSQASALLTPIWRYWQMAAIPADGAARLRRLLEAGYRPVGEDGARFLHALGTLEAYAGDGREAELHLEQAIALWGELARPGEVARSRANLGIASFLQGNFQRALEVFTETLSLARALGEEAFQIALYLDAARAATRCGDGSLAREYIERRARLLARQPVASPFDEAQGLVQSASICLLEGDYKAAQKQAAKAQKIFRKLGDADGLALALLVLGRAAYLNKDLAAARREMEDAVRQARLRGSPLSIGRALGYLAVVVAAQGETEEAAEMTADVKQLLGTMPDTGALSRVLAEIEELKSQGAPEAPPG